MTNCRLTIEQLQRIIANHESGVQLTGVDVYRQLLTGMQREERLKETLEFIAGIEEPSETPLEAVEWRTTSRQQSEAALDILNELYPIKHGK